MDQGSNSDFFLFYFFNLLKDLRSSGASLNFCKMEKKASNLQGCCED